VISSEIASSGVEEVYLEAEAGRICSMVYLMRQGGRGEAHAKEGVKEVGCVAS
jgi:hypothetical protein